MGPSNNKINWQTWDRQFGQWCHGRAILSCRPSYGLIGPGWRRRSRNPDGPGPNPDGPGPKVSLSLNPDGPASPPDPERREASQCWARRPLAAQKDQCTAASRSTPVDSESLRGSEPDSDARFKGRRPGVARRPSCVTTVTHRSGRGHRPAGPGRQTVTETCGLSTGSSDGPARDSRAGAAAARGTHGLAEGPGHSEPDGPHGGGGGRRRG